jgi:hypothetical protein
MYVIIKVSLIRILFTCIILCLIFMSGCFYDSKENLYPSLGKCTDTVNVTYTSKIAPILKSYCNTCHYSGASNVQNVFLDTYDGVKKAVTSQSLFSSITQDGTVTPMPNTGGKLTDCQISAFSIWIKAGSPKN